MGESSWAPFWLSEIVGSASLTGSGSLRATGVLESPPDLAPGALGSDIIDTRKRVLRVEQIGGSASLTGSSSLRARGRIEKRPEIVGSASLGARSSTRARGEKFGARFAPAGEMLRRTGRPVRIPHKLVEPRPSRIVVGEQTGADEFREYLEAARARWLAQQTATVAELRQIYRDAARDVSRDIRRLLPTQPSAQHLRTIEGLLNELARDLSEESLRATLHGVDLTQNAAITGAQRVAQVFLGDAFAAGGIRAMYQSVNQRALLTFATRARQDGLKLSDRVWNHGQATRAEVRKVLEHGIARGLDSRKVALEVQRHLDPTRSAPHSLSVRRRLGISTKVDYRAMRLARTEMSIAFREGTVLGHSRTPSYVGSAWELSASHPFQDDCDDLVGGGDGPGGIYLAGNEPFAPHPNCMCVLSPVHEDLDSFLSRLDRWRNSPSSEPALEDWYQGTARPFFEGRPTTTAPARARVPRGVPAVTAEDLAARELKGR